MLQSCGMIVNADIGPNFLLIVDIAAQMILYHLQFISTPDRLDGLTVAVLRVLRYISEKIQDCVFSRAISRHLI